MLFRILIVITIFIVILLGIETVRYFVDFRNKTEIRYFRFLRKELTPFTFAIIIVSCLPYVMSILAFVVCYVIHGDVSFMIEYFSK